MDGYKTLLLLMFWLGFIFLLQLFIFVVLLQDLSVVFNQLIGRAESCQKQIQSIVQPDSTASSKLIMSSKYVMPQAEPIMIQAAVKREADAALEELLGNLNR